MNQNNNSGNNNQVITFGCRLNIYESEIIRKNIELSGLSNVCVINTCTVTKEAEKQAKQTIRKIKRNSPDIKIIVTGCGAQNNPSNFFNMKEVDKVIGNEEKLDSKNYSFEGEKVLVNDIMSIKETAPQLITNFEGRTRGFIQIQNGCNHRCTFCIIPFARGNSRSVPIGAIVEQTKLLVEQGYNEIVLTGVDVTDYGLDLPGTPKLGQMIKRLLNLVPDLKRLRLSSIDVAEIDDELFELMSYHKKLMPHFHISLQAGDNMILKRMKRRHNREKVIEFCNNLRSIRKDVSFGADIIAGFPTETEEMFLNSKNLISEAGLQYLHVFPYSERENTPASRMPQIDINVRRERARILREEGEKQLQIFYTKFIGGVFEVLIEKDNIGRLENFIQVKLDKPYEQGKIANVSLLRISGGYIEGKLLI
jgi:threonylcarbamoyladenosine tRNA methylthiotransferase MtaB